MGLAELPASQEPTASVVTVADGLHNQFVELALELQQLREQNSKLLAEILHDIRKHRCRCKRKRRTTQPGEVDEHKRDRDGKDGKKRERGGRDRKTSKEEA
uniref:BZIP domain-containing protein n=1 Tax=Mycena chlorophos TaxID=658473 RepID=A0ABQ0L891_MYCCL|nr:predicted protein [Mycena chlorophos]